METIYTRSPWYVAGQPRRGLNLLWDPRTEGLDEKVAQWMAGRVRAKAVSIATLFMTAFVCAAFVAAGGPLVVIGVFVAPILGGVGAWRLWWSLTKATDRLMPDHLVVTDSELHTYFSQVGDIDKSPPAHQVWMAATLDRGVPF